MGVRGQPARPGGYRGGFIARVVAVWDEDESAGLGQARKAADLTFAPDPVRAYLKRIDSSALLAAEQDLNLAKRIEAGLYAAERLRCASERQVASPRMRWDLSWIIRDGQRAKNNLP